MARWLDMFSIAVMICSSLCIKKVYYYGPDGISITITGASNELTEISYLPLLAATAKCRLVVSFQRRSLIVLRFVNNNNNNNEGGNHESNLQIIHNPKINQLQIL